MSKPSSKYLTLTLVAIVVAFISAIVYKVSELNERRSARKDLPQIVFVDMVGNETSLSTLKYDSVVLVYFNPQCSICHDFAASVSRNASALKNHHFVFIAPTTIESTEIKIFEEDLLRSSSLSYTLLIDVQSIFPGAFGMQAFPSILVYHHGLLYKSFSGITNPQNLLPAR